MFNSIWYHSLIKPVLSPPDIIFAPVWSVLYFTIFCSLVLYISKPSKNKFFGYLYFITQLLLNAFWVYVFFGMQNIAYALYIIILLDVFVLLTIKDFYNVTKQAGLVLIPYFIWILFATYLNTGYLILNR